MLETNIDNMSGEVFSFIFPKLFDSGALDVFVTPIFMKKNRPASKLSVMCLYENKEALEKIVFSETTTIGIRNYELGRTELKREYITENTKYGTVTGKAVFLNGELIRYYPEYDECAAIAKERGIPFQNVYNDVLCELQNKIKNRRI